MDDEMIRELAGIKTRLDTMEQILRHVAATSARIVGDLAEIKQNMATKSELAELRSEVNSRMDGFAGLFEDMRFRWAVHADTLKKHDGRLKKLETRRA